MRWGRAGAPGGDGTPLLCQRSRTSTACGPRTRALFLPSYASAHDENRWNSFADAKNKNPRGQASRGRLRCSGGRMTDLPCGSRLSVL
jgi:hypothetical protein